MKFQRKWSRRGAGEAQTNDILCIFAGIPKGILGFSVDLKRNSIEFAVILEGIPKEMKQERLRGSPEQPRPMLPVHFKRNFKGYPWIFC